MGRQSSKELEVVQQDVAEGTEVKQHYIQQLVSFIAAREKERDDLLYATLKGLKNETEWVPPAADPGEESDGI